MTANVWFQIDIVEVGTHFREPVTTWVTTCVIATAGMGGSYG
jgi:hypothetical protein